MQPVKVIQHPSAEDIEQTFRAGFPLQGEDWAMVCRSPAGEEVSYTTAEVIQQIKSQRLWGFSIPSKREIHVWWACNAPKTLRFQLLTHELGHILFAEATPLTANADSTWPEELREEEEVESFSDLLYTLAVTAGLIREDVNDPK